MRKIITLCAVAALLNSPLGQADQIISAQSDTRVGGGFSGLTGFMLGGAAGGPVGALIGGGPRLPGWKPGPRNDGNGTNALCA